MVHEKKILHQYFEPLQNGTKRFELRKEDGAPYQVGDEIILREWNEEEGYTGHKTRRMITYVLRDCPEYGLKEGYVILGLSDGSWRSETREEKSMKVLREIETETGRLQVGDRIKVNYSGEEHYATAIEERGDIMLFLTDDYLDDAMPINTDDTTEGGWEESFLREKLQDLAENTDIKDQLVPFENGDLLTLLSIQEMFGLDEHFDKCSGQIEWLKDRRHRIADRKGEPYEWGWLRSVVSASYFACQRQRPCGQHLRVRRFWRAPCFRNQDLKSPPFMGGLKIADRTHARRYQKIKQEEILIKCIQPAGWI